MNTTPQNDTSKNAKSNEERLRELESELAALRDRTAVNESRVDELSTASRGDRLFAETLNRTQAEQKKAVEEMQHGMNSLGILALTAAGLAFFAYLGSWINTNAINEVSTAVNVVIAMSKKG